LCAELVLYVQQRHLPVVSRQVMDEFARVLEKKLRIDQPLIDSWRLQIESIALCVPTPAKPHKFCRDPKDDSILQAALNEGCDFLVSGDADLLCLKRIQKLPILTPRDFLEAMGVEEVS
jgi:putative PIN family toxin of toxin-antitoxin system